MYAQASLHTEMRVTAIVVLLLNVLCYAQSLSTTRSPTVDTARQVFRGELQLVVPAWKIKSKGCVRMLQAIVQGEASTSSDIEFQILRSSRINNNCYTVHEQFGGSQSGNKIVAFKNVSVMSDDFIGIRLRCSGADPSFGLQYSSTTTGAGVDVHYWEGSQTNGSFCDSNARIMEGITPMVSWTFCTRLCSSSTMGFFPISPTAPASICSDLPFTTTTTAINALSATSTIVPPLLPSAKSSTFLLPSPNTFSSMSSPSTNSFSRSDLPHSLTSNTHIKVNSLMIFLPTPSQTYSHPPTSLGTADLSQNFLSSTTIMHFIATPSIDNTLTCTPTTNQGFTQEKFIILLVSVVAVPVFLLTVVVTALLLLAMTQRKVRQKRRRNTVPAQSEVNERPHVSAAPSASAVPSVADDDYSYASIADLHSSTIRRVNTIDNGSIQLHDNMAYGEIIQPPTQPVPQD